MAAEKKSSKKKAKVKDLPGKKLSSEKADAVKGGMMAVGGRRGLIGNDEDDDLEDIGIERYGRA